MKTQELNATREQLRIHLEDFAVHKEQPYKRVERLEEDKRNASCTPTRRHSVTISESSRHNRIRGDVRVDEILFSQESN